MQKQPFLVEGGSKKLEDWGVTFAGGGGISTPLHAMIDCVAAADFCLFFCWETAFNQNVTQDL